ncbi:putative reverse transcriptase domain-containing protein [Tanacetum coccineum]
MTLYNTYRVKSMRESSCVKPPRRFGIHSSSVTRVTTIEEAKDLATLPLDELVRNLKVYEMILENDGIVSETTIRDKVKSLALKANITRGQTSNNSICQDESDEDKEITLLAKNFRKLSRKVSRCYNCGNKNHLANNCPKPNNKAFVGVTWSDSEDGDEPQNNATCLMAIDS